jgi:hypothetical protein
MLMPKSEYIIAAHCLNQFIQTKLMHLYCHNPTNNPEQLKTIFVGVVLLSVEINQHHTTPHYNHITIRAVLSNLGS